MAEPEAWTGIQPGDVGFDQGGGLVGFLIRHFSHSPYAHCWVYHRQREDGSWDTAEAYPGGLKMRARENANVHRVVRSWRNETERELLLEASGFLVGSKYNYRELFRIIHYRVRANLPSWAIASLVMFAWAATSDSTPVNVVTAIATVVTLYGAMPLKTKLNPDAVICSNHVAQSVRAARPEAGLTYEPQAIWPGRLERDLNVLTWNDWTS